jgi:hypothetical protein
MFRCLIVTVVAGLCAVPRPARAEGYVSPWAGVQFGSSADNGRGAFGVTAGAMSGGIFGGELDFGYSPSFFGTKSDFGSNTLVNLMGNLIIGVPVGGTHGAGFRPYVTGGVGLIRTQIDGGTVFRVSSSNNQLGADVGAGAMGFFNEHFGLRGDVRYFRNLTGDSVGTVDFGSLHFWRVSAGIVIR